MINTNITTPNFPAAPGISLMPATSNAGSYQFGSSPPGGCGGFGNGSRGFPPSIPAILRRPDVLEKVQIREIDFRPLDGKLTSPFAIASDHSKTDELDNVLVAIHAGGNLVGLGEAAPFPGISGDSQKGLLEEIHGVVPELSGRSFNVFELEAFLKDRLKFPAAKTAIEMAFFDILAKRRSLTLAEFLNPRAVVEPLRTDITIPIVDSKAATRLARKYCKQGFSRIKVKVGDNIIAALCRVSTIRGVYDVLGKSDSLELLIDANEGYSVDEAIVLMHALNDVDSLPKVFEQPIKRDDIDGFIRVRDEAEQLGVLMSLFTLMMMQDKSLGTKLHTELTSSS